MKKKLMKNLFVAVMMVVLCLAVGMTASAETFGDYEYRVLENGTVEITKYNGNETAIEIPSMIDEKMVTSIGEMAFWHENCETIISIIVPNSITNIGDCAFNCCYNLEEIILQEGILSIGNQAFGFCRDLESIYIPNTVQTIGDGAFIDCASLTSITIPSSVTYIGGFETFYECVSLTSINVDENNEYYSSDEFGVLFDKNKTILINYPIGNKRTSYIMPDSVSVIKTFAFMECLYLEEIDFSENLIEIEYAAFPMGFCFKELYLPKSVQKIGDMAFYSLLSVEKIYIESMQADIGEISFGFTDYDISGLESQEIAERFANGIKTNNYDELLSILKPFENPTGIGTIYCHAGSTAETYAIENNLEYVLTHFYEDEWTYDYENLVKYRKCIHCDETESETIEPELPAEPEEPVTPEKESIFTKVFDLIKMFFNLILSWFNK